MARRVLRPRNLRWALTGLAIACLAALGWSWGRAGIDKPAVSLGYALRDVVRVWTSDPDAGLVNFTWTTQPSGEVRITVQLHRQISAPVTVLVALECDTRLGQFTVDDSNHAVVQSGTAGDDNRGCDEGSTQSAFLARPVQLLQVRFDGPEDNWDYIALEGRTVSPWSDEAAGERVAYTPYVWLGGPFPGTAPPMGDLIDASIVPLVPDVAVVDTNLAGRPSEIVESYFPTDTPLAIFGSNVGATGEIETQVTPAGPRVRWTASWAASAQQSRGIDSPRYVHTTAVVRWSDSSGLARAQFRLLLAGLFLGIVGSVVIEGLFAWARSAAPRPGRPSRRPRPDG